MKKNFPKRIAIIGLPGSGKSTFAIELGKVLCVPVHHLDQHMFEPNGKKKDKKELLAIEQAMVNEESWIVKDNATSRSLLTYANACAWKYSEVKVYLLKKPKTAMHCLESCLLLLSYKNDQRFSWPDLVIRSFRILLQVNQIS